MLFILEIMKEKTLMNRFFELLKTEQNKAAYGREQVKKVIELGAVDKLLLSEAIDEKDIDVFSELAEHYSTEVIIISIETNEGLRLKELGGFAAILRYAIYS